MSPPLRPLSCAGREENGSLTGSRILLRRLADEDLPAIEAWWPEAAATVRGVREPVAIEELHQMIAETTHRGSQARVLIRADDTAPIGLLVYRLKGDACLEFRFLALARDHRGRGYGSEAVMLVEQAGLAERFAASVYHGNGLGLYFWLRMGYRPAEPGEPARREAEAGDKISMLR